MICGCLTVAVATTAAFVSFTLLQTIEDYEDENQISYIKLINVGQKVITRNCHGYLPSQVAFYLQNVHIYPRKIFLSVNAEAMNVSDLVGGKRKSTYGNATMPSVGGVHSE